MKFTFFKEFRTITRGRATEELLMDIFKYLRDDMTKTYRELSNGLNSLSFTDNFQAFEVTVTVSASTTLQVPNQLGGGRIPTQMIVVNGDGRDLTTDRTTWDENFTSVINNAVTDRTVTLVFTI